MTDITGLTMMTKAPNGPYNDTARHRITGRTKLSSFCNLIPLDPPTWMIPECIRTRNTAGADPVERVCVYLNLAVKSTQIGSTAHFAIDSLKVQLFCIYFIMHGF